MADPLNIPSQSCYLSQELPNQTQLLQVDSFMRPISNLIAILEFLCFSMWIY